MSSQEATKSHENKESEGRSPGGLGAILGQDYFVFGLCSICFRLFVLFVLLKAPGDDI